MARFRFLQISIYPYLLTVIGGTGMGQQRFLSGVVYDPETPGVYFDFPFDVNLDSTSFICISKMKGRVLAVNNNFNAEGR